ncbi:hypothetical protein FKM82_007936 [Ascaphus truei]
MERGFSDRQFQEAWRELDEPVLPRPWQLFTESMGIQIYRLYDETLNTGARPKHDH